MDVKDQQDGAEQIASVERPVHLPRGIIGRPFRKPQDNIPPTRPERETLREAVRAYVASHNVTPPVPFDDLRAHADRVVGPWGWEKYRDYAAILISNESWRDVLAAIPFDKRLLLLPVCLRDEAKCPAPFDEFGLLCKECGQCSIHDFKIEAERLGYALLVAEGTPIVMQMIESGQIQAVVGVSCLNVLERVFPYMESAAVPGIAIPLLQDDCKDTTLDIEWIWDVIHLTSADRAYRMDLERLRGQVDAWFTEEALAEVMPGEDPTTRIARAWLGRAGKRWRPFLTACTYQACQADPEADLPEALRPIAIAVECFHKASLVHDDIEDDDAQRYGEDTLHTEHGVPVALNVGDFLLGEGYRLLAEADATSEQRARMLHVAALGHRTLSMGQGAELVWANDPQPMRPRDVLAIFRQKTAPAFEVALKIGAVYAGTDEAIWRVMGEYSEALGVAYQIRDDLDDIFGEDSDSNDAKDVRPSLLLALAHEKASGETRDLFAALWRRQLAYDEVEDRVKAAMLELRVEERVRTLLDAYQEEAVRALRPLENPTIKGLLRRVIGKIFDQARPGALCSEFTSRNAPGREALAPLAG